jgi:hypothetical protein
MPEGAAVGVLLLFGALAICVVVETLLEAVCLRAGVALYNNLSRVNNNLAGDAPSAGSVPRPALGKAMWITFARILAQFIVASFVGLVTSPRATAAGVQVPGIDAVAQLIAFPVSLLIMAEMLSTRLPTTFGRAILVILCYLLVVLLVGVLVGIAVVLLFGVALRGA